MSNFPVFSSLGYQVESELGHNHTGGRVTYLATDIKTQQPVVIKQFQFAQSSASWASYEAYEREIQVLRSLNYPHIPRYLNSFETPTGFCLVQEYKPAQSLANRCFQPEEIKLIAIALLNILAYLQSQTPPVIHRDIKPENILVDDLLQVYLVDFGFARIGSGEIAVSSVVKGTLGFMPPEQLFNRELTQASDLYSLGATLICLLTGIKSTDIGNLIDANYRFNFRKLLPNLHPQFINWLQKMVEPNFKERYANASAALEALKPISVYRNDKKRQERAKAAILTTVSLGLLYFSTSILTFYFSRDSNVNVSASEKFTARIKPVHWEIFTTELDQEFLPTNTVEEISLNQNRVYFYVRLSLPSNQYNGSCKIFDSSGTLVYEGISPLIADNNKLDTWCVYDFNPEVDKTGIWKFEFYLDGQKVVTKKLTVLPTYPTIESLGDRKN